MTVNSETYYFSIINYLQRKTSRGEEVTRKELDAVIKKTMKVKEPLKVVKRLKELGYITQERKEIIRFIKGND